jgi:hypothetical protein
MQVVFGQRANGRSKRNGQDEGQTAVSSIPHFLPSNSQMGAASTGTEVGKS